MQKLTEVSHGRKIQKIWHKQNRGCLWLVGAQSPMHARDLTGLALPDPNTGDGA